MRNIHWPLLLLLSACSSTQPPADPSLGQPSPSPVSAERISNAATAPLSDLNLIRTKIPEVLKAAQKAPYVLPEGRGCADLAAEVRLLDAALGADLDTSSSADNPSLLERGSDEAGNAAIGALKSASQGLIPFRGWVRKLSGAERYSKQVAAAIAAGSVRRAYLKGLGQAQGCLAPAAPVQNNPAAQAGEVRLE